MAAGDPTLRGLFFLDLAPLVVIVAAWFAISFSGRYPGGMLRYAEGVIRWNVQVTATR